MIRRSRGALRGPLFSLSPPLSETHQQRRQSVPSLHGTFSTPGGGVPSSLRCAATTAYNNDPRRSRGN